MRSGGFDTASEAEKRAFLLMRAALDPAARWRGRLTIPQSAHPLVRDLFGLLNQSRTTVAEVARRAGIQRKTISGWRVSRNPTLPMFEAALNAIGYELVIRERRG